MGRDHRPPCEWRRSRLKLPTSRGRCNASTALCTLASALPSSARPGTCLAASKTVCMTHAVSSTRGLQRLLRGLEPLAAQQPTGHWPADRQQASQAGWCGRLAWQALGRPAWAALRRSQEDWRYRIDSIESEWLPLCRSFWPRQNEGWTEVFNKIGCDLDEYFIKKPKKFFGFLLYFLDCLSVRHQAALIFIVIVVLRYLLFF